jgi:hypothetical protein
MNSWQNDIQSLVKKCRILALNFFPSVECLYRVHVDRCIRTEGILRKFQNVIELYSSNATETGISSGSHEPLIGLGKKSPFQTLYI